MKPNREISCPVSASRINENAARAAAFYVIGIAVLSLFFGNYILSFLLGLDFAMRAFTSGEWSPLKRISKRTVQLLDIRPKPTDAAPKKFAAGIGMVFSLAIALFQYVNLTPYALR